MQDSANDVECAVVDLARMLALNLVASRGQRGQATWHLDEARVMFRGSPAVFRPDILVGSAAIDARIPLTFCFISRVKGANLGTSACHYRHDDESDRSDLQRGDQPLRAASSRVP